MFTFHESLIALTWNNVKSTLELIRETNGQTKGCTNDDKDCTFWMVESSSRQQQADTWYHLKKYRLPKTVRQNCKYIFPQQIMHSAVNPLCSFIEIFLKTRFCATSNFEKKNFNSIHIVRHFDFVLFLEDTSRRISSNSWSRVTWVKPV